MNQKKKRSPADDLVKTLLDQSQDQDDVASAEENPVGETINLDQVDGAELEPPFSFSEEEKTSDDIDNIEQDALDDTAAITFIQPDKSYQFPDQEVAQETVRLQDDYDEKNVVIGRANPGGKVRLGGDVAEVESHLAQAENLRIAQERILDLETELDRLRSDNEQLLAAGETLRRRADDLASRAEKAEIDLREEIQTGNAEKKLLQESLLAKDRDISRLRERTEELEMRLESDLKKIRVRERELENRLELVKMEEAALLRNKDDIILEMKRKVDQLTAEMDNYRNRGLELHKQIDSDQERFRRTVKALRLALTMLEETQADVTPLKKAE